MSSHAVRELISSDLRFELARNERYMSDRLLPELNARYGGTVTFSRLGVPRVIPRKDGDLTIQYELTAAGADEANGRIFLLCGHLRRATGDQVAPGGKTDPRIVEFSDLGLTIPLFPYDPKLHNLVDYWELYRDSERSETLRRAAAAEYGQGDLARVEILSYRLEKRCVFRYTSVRNGQARGDDGRLGRLIVKVLRPGKLERVLHALSFLEEHGFDHDCEDGLSIVRVLSTDVEQGCLIMAEAPGKSLHETVMDSAFVRGCNAAGLLLRKLHLIDEGDFASHSVEVEIARLSALVDSMQGLYADLSDRINDVFALIQESAPAAASLPGPVCSHADYYDKQVFYSAERTTLLDCDGLVMSDPAMDYCNFLAHLQLRALQYPAAATAIQAGAAEFAEAYGSENHEKFGARENWWLATSLLRISILYLLRPRWRHVAPDLLELAQRCLRARI